MQPACHAGGRLAAGQLSDRRYTRFEFEPNDTYVQYNTYSNINQGGTSIGFDNRDPHHFTLTTMPTSSLYRLDLSSANQIGGGE